MPNAVTNLAAVRDAAHEPPRRQFDEARIARAVREILLAIGEDPDRDGLADTPRRVGRAYSEIFAGLREDPTRHLERTFAYEGGADDLVVVRDIEIFSVCEHHLLPFTGRAHVAYLPSADEVVLVTSTCSTRGSWQVTRPDVAGGEGPRVGQRSDQSAQAKCFDKV